LVYANRRTGRGQTDGHIQERLTDRQSRDRWTARGERHRHRTGGRTDRGGTYGKKRVETDGQTNMTKLIDAFRDYAKVPKK
jgi:hypothetical protein